MFQGFSGESRLTPVPGELFNTLLESIQDVDELKCTLRVIWLLNQKRGRPRYVTRREALMDNVLLAALKGMEVIEGGLKKAVERGTLLCTAIDVNGASEVVYMLNGEAERAYLRQSGKEAIPGSQPLQNEVAASRPNVFALYEQNIGMVTPLLAERLKDAEGRFPGQWIEEAFRIAVERNKRNWRYIEAILERWATEGREDGESGRHTPPTDRKAYLREFLKRGGTLPKE